MEGPSSAILGAVIAWCAMLALVCWFLGFLELFAASRFLSFSYWIGLPVPRVEATLAVSQFRIPTNRILRTSTGQFKFLTDHECLFFPVDNSSQYRIGTPWPIKGRLTWHEQTVNIQGRLPLSPTLFFLAGLVILGAMLLLAARSEGDPFPNILGILIGLAGVGVIILFSLTYEWRRYQQIIREFRHYVQMSLQS